MQKISDLYETDFNLWVESQLQALKAGQYENVDLLNLLEEVEGLARRDRQSLRNYLSIIFTHLLEWQFQAEYRSNRWKVTIRNSRLKIFSILESSPSLKNYLPTVIERAYLDSLKVAVNETGLPPTTFPSQCPYTLEEILDRDFLPDA